RYDFRGRRPAARAVPGKRQPVLPPQNNTAPAVLHNGGPAGAVCDLMLCSVKRPCPRRFPKAGLRPFCQPRQTLPGGPSFFRQVILRDVVPAAVIVRAAVIIPVVILIRQ